jgi:membrane associated rhomboid family serine protease
MGWEDRAYNRDNTGGIPPVQFRLPPISRLTLVLIVVNLTLFLAGAFSRQAGGTLEDFGALTYGLKPIWQVWRFVTYQYLHASAGHVFFNMLALYFFLPALELRWGWQKAFGFYTLGGIAAGVVFMIIAALTGRPSILVGASGSIFACMGAVALFYPERQLILLVFPVPMRVAVALFAVFFLLSVVGDRSFGDAAHLGGLAFGFLGPWLAGPYLRNQQDKYRRWSAARVKQAEIDEQTAVDRILDKVAQSGMHSLTEAEKKTLARASENQRKRDAQRAARY